MKRHFSTFLLDDSGKMQTRTVSGVEGVVVYAEKQVYSFEEMTQVVSNAYELERCQYGWEVSFMDSGQRKRLFLRLYGSDKCNATTSEKQTIHEWIEHLYDRDTQQVQLF
ncbi:hypothetical protein [Atopococcus tabaci]|uniref:hypothetical protein n=1 Tax=Atopococcus tabaci TaxID=269774 RepID=UPI002409A7A9|nr:hypothetical protein [Atopococcus tabaci]